MFTISKSKSLLCLFGPTAVGKTELLVRSLSGRGEVVIADSIQVYQGLDIGSAKPSPLEIATLPHHLIDIRIPDQTFSVGDFCLEAEKAIQDIQSRDRLPVISGGTAFYFKNFIYGMPKAPPSDPLIRTQVEALFLEKGPQDFLNLLRSVDPVTAARLGERDYYRQKRAYEVYLSSGQPLTAFAGETRPREDFRILLLGLTRPREDMVKRLDARVDVMMDRGLLNEVEGLVEAGYNEESPALKAIGYAEFLPWILRKEGSVKEAVQRVKFHSHQYAKRQMTFFRSLESTQWIDADDDISVQRAIDGFV